MKLLYDFLIVLNTALFILNCLFSGISFAQSIHGPAAFFAIIALVHGLGADTFAFIKSKKFPKDQ